MRILKRSLFCITLFICLFWFSQVFAAEREITLIINDNYVEFEQKPVLVNGRVLVPFRAIFEEFGFTVNWDNNTETATGINDRYEISFRINDNISKVYDKYNDVKKDNKLDVTAQMIKDRTYIPLRALSESMGADISWDDSTYTVNIHAKIADMKDSITLEQYMSSPDDKIGAGYDFGAVVDAYGNLYFWGNDEKVGLFSEGTNIINIPKIAMNNVSKIKCGSSYIVILNKNGELYIFGDTMLNFQNDNSSNMVLLKNISDIEIGNNHILALSNDGLLYVWGDNKDGQIGLADKEFINEPTLIADNVVQIDAADDYSIIKLKDNRFVCLGNSLNKFYSYNVEKKRSSTIKFTNLSEICICSSDANIIVKGFVKDNVEDIYISNDILVVISDSVRNLYYCSSDFEDSIIESDPSIAMYPKKINDVIFKFDNDSLSSPAGSFSNMSYTNFGNIIDDVAYFDAMDCECAIILLKDGSVWTMGYGKSGTIGNGKNLASITPYYLMSIVTTENDNSKIRMELVSAKDYSPTYDLGIQFYNENDEIICPIGMINVKITNDDGTIYDKEMYITEKMYKDNVAIIELKHRDFNKNYIKEGYVYLEFRKSYVNIRCNGIARGLPHKSEKDNSSYSGNTSVNYPSYSGSSSGSSSNSSMYDYYNQMVKRYTSELQNVMQERNVRVYSGGRWIYTYNHTAAAQIQEQIDYYTALRDSCK